MNNLLAAGGWTLDVAFFVILLVGILLGVMRGFVAGICKLAGKIFSVAVAVVFCVSFFGNVGKLVRNNDGAQ